MFIPFMISLSFLYCSSFAHAAEDKHEDTLSQKSEKILHFNVRTTECGEQRLFSVKEGSTWADLKKDVEEFRKSTGQLLNHGLEVEPDFILTRAFCLEAGTLEFLPDHKKEFRKIDIMFRTSSKKPLYYESKRKVSPQTFCLYEGTTADQLLKEMEDYADTKGKLMYDDKEIPSDYLFEDKEGNLFSSFDEKRKLFFIRSSED